MTLLPLAAEIASWMLLAAAGLVFVRLVLGPGTADRAVALDMLSVLVAAFAGLRAMVTGVDAYLDVAAALALVGFLATLCFARYTVRQARLQAAGGTR